MKEYGMTVHQAYEKLRALIDEAWMEIVQGCLCKTQPMELLEKVVNVARVMDNMYKRDDAYTNPYSLKDTITSMYVNSV
jgi:(-)-germacrene D synthase